MRAVTVIDSRALERKAGGYFVRRSHSSRPGHDPLKVFAFLLAGVLWLAPVPSVGGACGGVDLFPSLKARSPAAFAAMAAAGRSIPHGRGKLFRVTSATSAPSYVFGTLHLDDPRATDFSPKLRDALERSKIVALETVEDGPRLHAAVTAERAGLGAALLAPADRRADRLLSPGDYAALEKAFESRGLTKPDAAKLKPAVVALLLDLPSCAIRKKGAKPYADELVARIAREKGIEVVGLETMAEQLSILDGLPREVDRQLLIATLRQEASAEDVVETTLTRYEAADLGGLLAWMRSPEPLPGKAGARTPPAFLDRLITARNQRMRDRILPLVSEGGAFVAVGAAHLPGEDGLLRLLEDNGYTIELVE